MRRLIRRAPLWVRCALGFLILAVTLLLADLIDQAPFGDPKGFTDLVVDAVVRAVIIGPGLVLLSVYSTRRAARVTQIERSDELRTVIRASTRGPVPADPRLRRAARALAEDQLEQRLMKRPFAVFFMALLAVAFGAAAVFWSFWYVFAVLFFVALIAAMWIMPRRLQRRIDLLAEPDPASSGADERPWSSPAKTVR